ncbi:MAG: 5-oxoprolinase/urea amidolyase family protein [Planctomycetes bacterium]|nr:5-oxoprolinase/urea amidolyase family protein [Planctomycetota bacterium]
MSFALITPQTRHLLRERCDELGLRFGRAPQWVRRVGVIIAAGQLPIDRELTLRQGDRCVIELRPAPALDDLRAQLHLAAASLVGELSVGQAMEVVFVIADGAAIVEELSSSAVQPALSGVTTATARIVACAAGRLIAASVPEGADLRVAIGDAVISGAVLVYLVARGIDASAALAALARQVATVQLAGVVSDQRRIAALCAHPAVADGTATAALIGLPMPPADIAVLTPGIQTTVQDSPGRIGYWAVGVPPSGPMDDLALRLGNRAVGNPDQAAGLEMTLGGVALRFGRAAVIALTGAVLAADLDGRPVAWWKPIQVPSGGVLKLGGLENGGVRSYLSVRGGIAAPLYLGSRSTFTLGGFGGPHGRELRAGDELAISDLSPVAEPADVPKAVIPRYEKIWRIGVLYGPHGAPDFFKPADIREFFAATWSVSPQSNRTGVRLIGPKPRWARTDGGEAGLHPSNIHDNAYALGAVDFTGDMPVVLGPDGPSLGGFVCPVVVAAAERWKLGQLKAGDQVRFVRLDHAAAREQAAAPGRALPTAARPEQDAVLHRLKGNASAPAVCYRRAGDEYLLIEYGPLVLDLGLRMRVYALETALRAGALNGIIDLTAGIRSLQIHYDPAIIAEATLLKLLIDAEAVLPDADHLVVPSRTVHLPLSWDDPATQKAIDIYMRTVRKDAPWCPSNLEFIRRVNGLDSIDDVQRTVFNAEYLVLGLGDVYLGAPVATPVDPRHRLVTTKYNPARTWTPENAVGIGGAYMCVYGMEGPGGYQFVGRTVQMWNSWRATADFAKGTPWLLRQFDRIRFYPVSAEELLRLREEFPRGRLKLRIEDGEFSLAKYRRFLADNDREITAFTKKRDAAFAAERARWQQAGT